MQALDLEKTRPRKAREELAGITFLPRSIDKVRGMLPGGNAFGFKVEGFTEHMLDDLGISVDEFTALVARAQNDDEIVAYITEHATPGGAETWNTFVRNREVYGGDRAEAISENPWLADHPEIVYSLDFLQYREDHGLDD